jgi:hypothetical protein
VGEFIASGRAIDVILVLMAAEAVALYVHGRRTGRGIAGPDVLINLAAGGSLMLAVRAALTDAGPGWVAVCLLASLGAHAVDLKRRWRRQADVAGRPQPPEIGSRRAGARA